ncbi:hypothetical protein Efla_001372 [Eimeria flavescens]
MARRASCYTSQLQSEANVLHEAPISTVMLPAQRAPAEDEIITHRSSKSVHPHVREGSEQKAGFSCEVDPPSRGSQDSNPLSVLRKDEQPSPFLVNLTGQPISVLVPRQISPLRGKDAKNKHAAAPTTHLATDDFGVERRKALRRLEEMLRAAGVGFVTVNAGESPAGDSPQKANDSPTAASSLESALHFSSGCSNALSPTRDVLGEWRTIRHEESLQVPLDDHGQPLKVTIRLHLVGSDFEISDLKFDTSNIVVRELPLKIPLLKHDVTKARDPQYRCRYDLLHFSARILARTVLMPDSRMFNTFLSSMLTIRNNTSTPVLIFPHPMVLLISPDDCPILQVNTDRCNSTRTKGCQSEGRPCRMLHQPRGRSEACKPYASTVMTGLSDNQEAYESPCKSSSWTHLSNTSDNSTTRSGLNGFVPEPKTPGLSTCVPLEIQASGGMGHIPLSWILPRAFVAHGLQLNGLKSMLCDSGDGVSNEIPVDRSNSTRGSGRLSADSMLTHTSFGEDTSRHSSVEELQSAQGDNFCGEKSALSLVSINGQHASHAPSNLAAGVKHLRKPDRKLVETLAKWEGDMTVESLLVIPSSCFAEAIAQQGLLMEESAGRRKKRRVWGRTGTSGPVRIRCASVDPQPRALCKIQMLYTAEDFTSLTKIADEYTALYQLARSHGAKPLVQQSSFQQMALGESNNILSYDFAPQVLEFRSLLLNDPNSARSDPLQIPTGTSEFGMYSGIEDRGHQAVVCTALAITMYGKSRELLSEADPLFFEIAINAPVSVGNRLFEPLHVALIPGPKWALHQQAEHQAGVSAQDQHGEVLPYGSVEAGGDVDIHLSASGFVLGLETTDGSSGYRHIYRSKPLSLNVHVPAPADAADMAVSFVRIKVCDGTGNTVQQNSPEYRLVSKQQPAEFLLLAEVLGWAQQNAAPRPPTNAGGSSSFDHFGLMDIKAHMWSTCVRTIRIFAPFWLINRRPEPLFVSYCRRSLQYLAPCDWRLLGVPHQGKALLALGMPTWGNTGHLLYPRRDSKDSMAPTPSTANPYRQNSGLKLCSAFRADIVGRSMAISVPTTNLYDKVAVRRNPRKLHHLGVTVNLAPPPFSRSKLISIYDRFVLKNVLPYDIWIKESAGSDAILRLEAASQKTFHPQALGPHGEALICIATANPSVAPSALEDNEEGAAKPRNQEKSSHDEGEGARRPESNIWSSQLSIARNSNLQIRVKKCVSDPRSASSQTRLNDAENTGYPGRAALCSYVNIQVTIQLVENASFLVVFSEAYSPEYLLVNKTNHLIAFTQSGIRGREVWELLRKGQQVEYAWTDPQRERKLLRLSFWDGTQQVIKSCHIARIRVHRPLTLPKSKETIYLITDVCESRRRVTATTTAPYDSKRLSAKGYSTWKSIPQELFKKRLKREVRGALHRSASLICRELQRSHLQEAVKMRAQNPRLYLAAYCAKCVRSRYKLHRGVLGRVGEGKCTPGSLG